MRTYGAEVAEWQTRWSQKPLRATSCGFDSLPRHHLTPSNVAPSMRLRSGLHPRRYNFSL